MVCEGFMPDIVAYSAAMDGLVKIHEVDRAFEMFQDICTVVIVQMWFLIT